MPQVENIETKALLTWTYITGDIVGIQFDAVLSEFLSRSAELSSHGRAGNTPIYDNYVPNPVAISIEAEVTNTPVIPAITHMDGVTGSKQLVDIDDLRRYGNRYKPPDPGLISARLASNLSAQVQGSLPLPPKQRRNLYQAQGANVLVFSKSPNRVINVFTEIQRLMDERIPLTIALTNFKSYPFENMYITQFQIPYDVDTGDAMIVRLDFEQAEISRGAQATKKTVQPAPKNRKHGKRGTRRPKPTDGTALDPNVAAGIKDISLGNY